MHKNSWWLLLLLGGLSNVAKAQILPEFSCINGNKEIVDQSTLSPGMPVIIVYFDPYCNECIEQARSFTSAKKSFENIQFVWITWETDLVAMEQFKENELSGLSHVLVCNDVNYQFDEWFGYSEVMRIMYFNSSWKKTGNFTDIIDVKTILELYNEK